jgi:hypothetical protein
LRESVIALSPVCCYREEVYRKIKPGANLPWSERRAQKHFEKAVAQKLEILTVEYFLKSPHVR